MATPVRTIWDSYTNPAPATNSINTETPAVRNFKHGDGGNQPEPDPVLETKTPDQLKAAAAGLNEEDATVLENAGKLQRK